MKLTGRQVANLSRNMSGNINYSDFDPSKAKSANVEELVQNAMELSLGGMKDKEIIPAILCNMSPYKDCLAPACDCRRVDINTPFPHKDITKEEYERHNEK